MRELGAGEKAARDLGNNPPEGTVDWDPSEVLAGGKFILESQDHFFGDNGIQTVY
jgi:hypothetical protein